MFFLTGSRKVHGKFRGYTLSATQLIGLRETYHYPWLFDWNIVKCNCFFVSLYIPQFKQLTQPSTENRQRASGRLTSLALVPVISLVTSYILELKHLSRTFLILRQASQTLLKRQASVYKLPKTCDKANGKLFATLFRKQSHLRDHLRQGTSFQFSWIVRIDPCWPWELRRPWRREVAKTRSENGGRLRWTPENEIIPIHETPKFGLSLAFGWSGEIAFQRALVLKFVVSCSITEV